MNKLLSQNITSEKLSEIIVEQIQREKAIRVTMEPEPHRLIPAEKFLNSRLVNSKRVYGCD